MRKTLLMTAAAACLVAGPALAQQIGAGANVGNSTGVTQTPQTSGSRPTGLNSNNSSMASPSMPSTAYEAQPMQRRPMHRAGMRGYHGSMNHDGMANQDGMANDGAAPPTGTYRGGAGSPFSRNASNITQGDTHSEIAPRLPNPDAAADTPRALLAAARRALDQGHTGAAQEALERAETRALSRTTDPSMAGQPDPAAMVRNIAEARRALGRKDMSAAKSAIMMAMSAPVPPPGPATVMVPGSPSGMPMAQPGMAGAPPRY